MLIMPIKSFYEKKKKKKPFVKKEKNKGEKKGMPHLPNLPTSQNISEQLI